MNAEISKNLAFEAIESIRGCIWDVDIPSPTVPEYVEHHEQMQMLMRKCDAWMSIIEREPAAQPKIDYVKDSDRIIAEYQKLCRPDLTRGEGKLLEDFLFFVSHLEGVQAKTAEWLPCNDRSVICSSCGAGAPHMYPYCNYCGARMRNHDRKYDWMPSACPEQYKEGDNG